MKKTVILLFATLLTKFGLAQDIALTGTSFSSIVIAVNQTTNFQSSFLNTDFTSIPLAASPADRLYVLISVPNNYYLPSPIGAAAVSGAGAVFFDWTVQPDGYTLKGTLNQPINPFDGGDINVVMKGVQKNTIPLATTIEFQDPTGFNESPTQTGPNLQQATLTITNPLAVSFTNINAQKSNCDVKVGWANSTELDLAKYEVEESKDGQNFVKVGEQLPTNSRSYSATFTLNDQIAANTIYVRIKAIDKAGKFQYSSIATVNGLCGQINWKLSAYPNPAAKGAYTIINAKEGVMDGTYTMQLVDITGKQISARIVDLDNAKTFKYQFDKALASGKYNLKITNKDGSQTTTIPLDIL